MKFSNLPGLHSLQDIYPDIQGTYHVDPDTCVVSIVSLWLPIEEQGRGICSKFLDALPKHVQFDNVVNEHLEATLFRQISEQECGICNLRDED